MGDNLIDRVLGGRYEIQKPLGEDKEDKKDRPACVFEAYDICAHPKRELGNVHGPLAGGDGRILVLRRSPARVIIDAAAGLRQSVV